MSKRGGAQQVVSSLEKGRGGMAGPGEGAWRLAGVMALLVLGVTAHFPGLSGIFIWDDKQWLTGIPYITQPGLFWKLWAPPGGTPHFFPLVTSGFWLEYRLWGDHPLGYHVTNLALHLGAVLLVQEIVRRLKLPAGALGAWLAAAVYAVHPVTVESVAWVAERKNTLCAVFFFASLLPSLRYMGVYPEESARPRDRWLGVGLFIAAMLSKSTAFFLPPALLVVAWWRRGRVTAADVVPTLPWWGVSLFFSGLGIYFEKHSAGTSGAIFDFSPVQRLVIAGNAFWFYLGKIVWPYPVMQIYPRYDLHAGKPIEQAAYFVGPVAYVVLVSVLAMLVRRTGRGPLAAVLLFAGGLFPALGFISFFTMQFTFVADHYQYLCLPVMLVLAVELALGAIRWAGPRLAAWESGKRQGVQEGGKLQRLLTGALVIGALGVLTTLSFGASSLYRSGTDLWGFNAMHNPSSIVLSQYAQALMSEPPVDYATVRNVLLAGVKQNPDDYRPYRSLSEMYLRLGDLGAAMRYRAAAEQRMLPQERAGLDEYFAEMGKVVQQRLPEREALRAGRELERAGRWEDAIAHYRELVNGNPADVEAELRVVFCLQVGKKDSAGAEALLGDILARHPESADAWFYRGWLMRLGGREEEARKAFEKALGLDARAAGRNAELLYAGGAAAPAANARP